MNNTREIELGRRWVRADDFSWQPGMVLLGGFLVVGAGTSGAPLVVPSRGVRCSTNVYTSEAYGVLDPLPAMASDANRGILIGEIRRLWDVLGITATVSQGTHIEPEKWSVTIGGPRRAVFRASTEIEALMQAREAAP